MNKAGSKVIIMQSARKVATYKWQLILGTMIAMVVIGALTITARAVNELRAYDHASILGTNKV